MKRVSIVLLLLAALVGCRTSQPATNPFLRTTVPPPATGAAIVVPGDQYYPSGQPGVVGAVPPGGAPPATAPIVTPAAPVPPPIVTPSPMAPPPVAPPLAIPPRDKFSPPGGSFQYNQSSLGPPNTTADPNQPGDNGALAQRAGGLQWRSANKFSSPDSGVTPASGQQVALDGSR